jgi:hypothetical protein
MTTPRVTELPRHLEPICADTFLGAREDDSPAPRKLSIARESRPLAVVLPLRPRDPLDPSRPAKPRRRTRRPPVSGGMPGPGGDAA